MTVTRNDQLRQWRWEEFRRRRLELDAWQDRVFRQWVFLQTVRTGLFAAFGGINWALFNSYALAFPFAKVEWTVSSRGEFVRAIRRTFEVDPKTAVAISAAGFGLALIVLWLERMLETLIAGRVIRGIEIESEIGIQTGFFRSVASVLHTEILRRNVPLGSLSIVLVILTLVIAMVWLFLGVSALTLLSKGG